MNDPKQPTDPDGYTVHFDPAIEIYSIDPAVIYIRPWSPYHIRFHLHDTLAMGDKYQHPCGCEKKLWRLNFCRHFWLSWTRG